MLLQYREYKKTVHKGNSRFIMLISLASEFWCYKLYFKITWVTMKTITILIDLNWTHTQTHTHRKKKTYFV